MISSPLWVPNSSLSVNNSCNPKQIPKNGLPDRIDQFVLIKVRHAIAKGSDTGQHHVTGVSDEPSLACHYWLMPHRFEGLVHAPKVAHAVVNDGNHDTVGR